MINVATICEPPTGVSDLTCHGDFSSEYSISNFHGRGSTDLRFTYVSVDFPECESARCAEIKNWCVRRPDVKATVWCQSHARLRLQMRTERVDPKRESKNPMFILPDPIDGLQVRCSDQGNRRNCSAYFEVAQDIWAEININGIEPGEEESRIEDATKRVHGIWDQLTLRSN